MDVRILCTCHVILVSLILVTTQLTAEEPGDGPSHNEDPTHHRNRYYGCREVRNRGHRAPRWGHVVVWAATSRGWCHYCLCSLCC